MEGDTQSHAVELLARLCAPSQGRGATGGPVQGVTRKVLLGVIRKVLANTPMTSATKRALLRVVCLRELLLKGYQFTDEAQLRRAVERKCVLHRRQYPRGFLAAGLVNRGGTRCFMLAAVHMLTLMPELFPEGACQMDGLSAAAARTIDVINPRTPGPWDAAALDAIASLPRLIASDDGGQQDPQEWLMALFDHDKLLNLNAVNVRHASLKVAKNGRARSIGPIVQDPCVPVTVPAEGRSWQGTLQQLIDADQQMHDLDDDDPVYFEDVKASLPARDGFRFVELGKYVICVLKNYKYTPQGATTKIDTKLRLETREDRTVTLQLHDAQMRPTISYIYHIISVVFHEGYAANRGHYVNWSWRDGREYVFDDDQSTEYQEYSAPSGIDVMLRSFAPYVVLLKRT